MNNMRTEYSCIKLTSDSLSLPSPVLAETRTLQETLNCPVTVKHVCWIALEGSSKDARKGNFTLWREMYKQFIHEVEACGKYGRQNSAYEKKINSTNYEGTPRSIGSVWQCSGSSKNISGSSFSCGAASLVELEPFCKKFGKQLLVTVSNSQKR